MIAPLLLLALATAAAHQVIDDSAALAPAPGSPDLTAQGLLYSAGRGPGADAGQLHQLGGGGRVQVHGVPGDLGGTPAEGEEAEEENKEAGLQGDS